MTTLAEKAAQAEVAWNQLYEFEKFIRNYVARITSDRFNPYIARLLVNQYLPNVIGDSDDLSIMRELLESPFGVEMIRLGFFKDTRMLNDLIRTRIDDFPDRLLNIFYIYGNLLGLNDMSAHLILSRTLYTTLTILPDIEMKYFVKLTVPIEGTILSSVLARKFENPDGAFAKHFKEILSLPEIQGERCTINLLKNIHSESILTAEDIRTFLTFSNGVMIAPILFENMSSKFSSVVANLPDTAGKASISFSLIEIGMCAYNNSVPREIQMKARNLMTRIRADRDIDYLLLRVIKSGFVTNVDDFIGSSFISDFPELKEEFFKDLLRNYAPIPSCLSHLVKDAPDRIIYVPGEELPTEHFMRNKFISFHKMKRYLPELVWKDFLTELKDWLIESNDLDKDEYIPEKWLFSICEPMFLKTL